LSDLVVLCTGMLREYLLFIWCGGIKIEKTFFISMISLFME